MSTKYKFNGAFDGSRLIKLDAMTAAIDVEFSTGIAQYLTASPPTASLPILRALNKGALVSNTQTLIISAFEIRFVENSFHLIILRFCLKKRKQKHMLF